MSHLKLNDFCFPVVERQVAVDDVQSPVVDWENPNTYIPARNHKAIVREDTSELISIVKDSYNVIPNEVLINKLLHFLATSSEPFRIDPTHSFVQDNRMRLQITFPDLSLQDSESEIPLSLFLHNSYDMSEGVRFYFGAIRAICSNGMVFGEILGKYYSKHTCGFELEDFASRLEEAKSYFPAIQNRIDQLQMLPATEQLVEQVSDRISKRLADQVLETQQIRQLSQWQLLNRVTHYISHDVDKPTRARHQQSVSRIFGL